MYACMYVCMYACMYVRMYVCMHLCMYVCMYVCNACIYIYTYIHIYIYIYIYIHTHTYHPAARWTLPTKVSHFSVEINNKPIAAIPVTTTLLARIVSMVVTMMLRSHLLFVRIRQFIALPYTPIFCDEANQLELPHSCSGMSWHQVIILSLREHFSFASACCSLFLW